MTGKQKKKDKALQLIAEYLGHSVEEPLESTEDLIRQAEAVLNYFVSEGKGFYTKKCGTCEEIFHFAWTSKSVGYCSVQCAKKALEKIGLKWNPEKPPTERWGSIYLPAIVPPEAAKRIEFQPPPTPVEQSVDDILAELE